MVARAGRRPVLRSRELVIPARVCPLSITSLVRCLFSYQVRRRAAPPKYRVHPPRFRSRREPYLRPLRAA